MVAVFDSPDYLFDKEQIDGMGALKKLLYFIYGILISLIHKYFQGALYTKLINLLLRKKVKLYFETPLYFGVDGDTKFYFSNKRVTRLLDGIDINSKAIFNHYLLDKIQFTSGDTVVDCGANVGELYLELDKVVKNLNYIAFEPDPEAFQCLEKNVKQDNSLLITKPLSNKSGYEKLYINTTSADTSLVFAGSEEFIEVETLSLDQLNISDIKLIKMDAEGHELEVLQGSRNTLKSTEFVSVDFGPEKGIEGDNTLPDVTNFLYENNFKMIFANTDRLIGLFKNEVLCKS